MEQENRINPILECANAIIGLLGRVFDEKQTAAIETNFREKLLQGFIEFERAAFTRQLSQVDILQAKYALCALADEVVLASAWAGRQQWLAKPLQLEFFGEHLAGEGFFKRLQELRQEINKNINIVEVYYICLQLGFEGMYRVRGIEQLLALQVDLRQQIELVRGIVPHRLADATKPPLTLTAQLSSRLPIWVIITIASSILFFIYLGFSFAINHAAGVTLQQLHQTANELEQQIATPGDFSNAR